MQNCLFSTLKHVTKPGLIPLGPAMGFEARNELEDGMDEDGLGNEGTHVRAKAKIS